MRKIQRRMPYIVSMVVISLNTILAIGVIVYSYNRHPRGTGGMGSDPLAKLNIISIVVLTIIIVAILMFSEYSYARRQNQYI